MSKSLLSQIQEVEKRYLILKATVRSPEGIEFVIDNLLSIVKERVSFVENNNLITGVKYNHVLSEFVYNCEEWIIYKDIKTITDPQVFNVFTGLLKILREYLNQCSEIHSAKLVSTN